MIDRCLPADALVRGFTKYDYDAVTLEDVYPGRGQSVQDVEWIRDAGTNGWIALTQNPRIWFTPGEREAVQTSGARVFSLARADLPSEFKAFVFGRRWLSITRRVRRADPCFWRLYVDGDIRRDLP